MAADGACLNREGETEKCRKTRKITTSVDWDCEIKSLFRNKNLSCKISVSSAIDWFSENVEERIILEDDRLPNQSFFWFCQELLDYYKNDIRVAYISSDNFHLRIIKKIIR